MSNATTAYGLTIAQASNVIAGATNVDGPQVDRDMIDVTNLSSPNAAKQFLAGLIDGGSVTISVNYMPQDTTHKALLTSLNAVPQTAQTYTITLTDTGASVVTFSGLVKSFSPKAAIGDKLAADFEVKVTGPVTFPS